MALQEQTVQMKESKQSRLQKLFSAVERLSLILSLPRCRDEAGLAETGCERYASLECRKLMNRENLHYFAG